MTSKHERSYGADTSAISLNALIPEADATWLSPDDIVVQSQPRRYFDPLKQEQLIRSIQDVGILEPLIVRPWDNLKYELVAGERRYRAALSLKLQEIPVVIKELNQTEALKITLTENLQRDDLNPVDETEGILQLLALELEQTPEQSRQLLYQMKNALEKSSKINSIEEKQTDSQSSFRDNIIPNPDSPEEQAVQSLLSTLGYNWYSFTCNRLPLLKLPDDILQALRQGKIEYTKAKEIAKLKDLDQRQELLKMVIAEGLSLKDIKAKIKDLKLDTKITNSSPKHEVQTLTRRLNDQRLWEREPETWQKIELLLQQVNQILDSVDNGKISGISKTTLAPIFDHDTTSPSRPTE
ncbi:MAG: ParB/RepB/Spo0J family partition protein [Snowella sp.]|nr:ParB/RepB/Spo0J family partition protein [Snowella sp.]